MSTSSDSTYFKPDELMSLSMTIRADLLSTYHTKRTPVLKTHYTPRNLCMVSGVFVPPSNAEKA